MGGMIGVPLGFFPVRMVLMKVASVYRVPRPVAASGVRFDATLKPHGPVHAVRSSDAWTSPLVGEGNGVVAGRPDNARVRSGVIPLTFGVWQSWHPVMVTR